MHWYVEDNGKLAGAIRLNIVNSLNDFDYGSSFAKFEIPSGPFAYFSRIAIHQDYRHKNIATRLAEATLDAFKKSNVEWGLTLYTFRGFAERFGFKLLGSTSIVRENSSIEADAYMISKH